MECSRNGNQAHLWLIVGLALALSAPPRVAAQDVPRVEPGQVTLSAESGKVSFSMYGDGLGLFKEIRIVSEDLDGTTEGIRIGMGRARGTRRNASIRTSDATPGPYRVELVGFRGDVVQLDLEVIVEGEEGEEDVGEEEDAPRVEPGRVTIPAAGGRVSFSIYGDGLGLFKEIRIISEDPEGTTEGISIGMGRARGTRRNASIRTSDATPGPYRVELVGFRDHIVPLDLEVIVEGDEPTEDADREEVLVGQTKHIDLSWDGRYVLQLNDVLIPVMGIAGGSSKFKLVDVTSGSAKHQALGGDLEVDDLGITSDCVAGNKAIEDVVRSWVIGEGKPASIVINELARDGSLKKSFVYEDCVPMSYVPPRGDTDPGEVGFGLHQLSLSPGRLQVLGPEGEGFGSPQTELIRVSVKRFRLELGGILIPGVTKAVPGTVEWDPETGEPSLGNWLIEIIRSRDPILERLSRYSAKAADGDAGHQPFRCIFMVAPGRQSFLVSTPSLRPYICLRQTRTVPGKSRKNDLVWRSNSCHSASRRGSVMPRGEAALFGVPLKHECGMAPDHAGS